MLKKTLISFFIFISLALVSLSIIFVYSEQSRNFIISKLNITHFINKKLENYLSNKINNDDIAIQIENIEFLKPKLPNIIHLRLNNIDINSITNNSKSEIGFVEIGFNYKSLIKNIFSDDGIYFDNLNFKNLTLNAQFQKDKIKPGPLIKIFSVVNENDVNKNKSIANILEKEITVGNIQLKISDNRNPIKELIYVVNCQNVFISRYIDKERKLNMQCQEKNKLEFSLNAIFKKDSKFFTGKINNFNPKKILDREIINSLNFFNQKISINLNGNYSFLTDKNFKLSNVNYSSKNSNLIINEKLNGKLLSNNFDGNFSWNSKDNILKFNEIFINNKLFSSGEIDLKEKVGFVNVSAQKLSIKNVKTHLKNHQNFYNQFINLDFYDSYNEKFRAGSLNDININLEYDFKQKFNLKKLSAELKFNNSRFADSNKIFKNIFATVSGSSSFNLKFKGTKIDVNESKISSDIVVSNGGVSLNSNLIINEKLNGKLLSNNFDGNFSWNSKDNILKFNEIFINNKLFSSGEIDLKEKVGFVNVSAQKLSIKNVKTHLKNHQNFYNQFINLDFYDSYNEKFRAGSLNDININLEYDFKQKFNLKKLSAELKFNNSRFADSNKIFKNIFATVSGSSSFNLKFKGAKIDVNESKISSDIVVSNGGVSFKEYVSQFKFESGMIKANFDKGINNISEIKLHNKNNISYFLNDISFKNQNYKISKAALIKNKDIKYMFEDTKIDKFNKIKTKVKIKNNDEISNYLKNKLNIELIGNATSNVTVEGDLNTFDFTLKLKSNLKNSFFNISSFGLEKQIGTSSSIQTEIIYKNSELKFLRNIDLEIERNKFKIGRVDLNNNPQRIILSKIKTPNFDLNKILLTKNNQKVSLLIDGTKLNLSTYKNNLRKTILNDKIEFDITADQILLDSKISMSGNLKGEIKNNIINSVVFGKMNLGKSSLLDSGKFKIYLDNKISKLSGIGLVGGAQTRIEVVQEKNKLPQIYFDTIDGGKLLNSLGFTKNIRSGKMKMQINFLNDSFSHYDGTVESEKFSLINAPGIINSLSVLSFAGVQSIITGEGILFEKGRANINIKDNLFNFDQVFLTNQSLAIKAKGTINENTKTLDITGTVAPIRLVSRVLSLVPAVGELLTGLKKDGLIAGQFKMSGSIDKPKTRLNPMSFAPGILRDIFANDWLNNNKLLLQNK
jgi:hypothetical protein